MHAYAIQHQRSRKEGNRIARAYSRIIPVYTRQEARRGPAWASPRLAWGHGEAPPCSAALLPERLLSELSNSHNFMTPSPPGEGVYRTQAGLLGRSGRLSLCDVEGLPAATARVFRWRQYMRKNVALSLSRPKVAGMYRRVPTQTPKGCYTGDRCAKCQVQHDGGY